MFSFECLSRAKSDNIGMLAFQLKLLLEVKPNESVRFHFHSNLFSEVKPDELAHFCIDSFRKPSRTSRRASTQLPCENQAGQACTFSQNHFQESSRQSLYTLDPNPLSKVETGKPVHVHMNP